jgi:hypothetical protein
MFHVEHSDDCRGQIWSNGNIHIFVVLPGIFNILEFATGGTITEVIQTTRVVSPAILRKFSIKVGVGSIA